MADCDHCYSCFPGATLKSGVSHLHLLHLQCPRGNAAELRGAYLCSSCGTWKRWKRLKTSPVCEQTDAGPNYECPRVSKSGKRALSHLMPLLEGTSNASAFAHQALEKSV